MEALTETVTQNDDRDRDRGRFTPVYDDADFIQAIRDRDDMASTRQVADAVGCDKDTAYRRLRSLRDEQNKLTSEDIGNTLLWRIDE